MKAQKADSFKKVDKLFTGLKHKNDKRVIKGRFYMEGAKLKDQLNFIFSFLLSLKADDRFVYKIYYWEKDKTIKKFLDTNSKSGLIKKKGKKIHFNGLSGAGLCLIIEDSLDVKFLKKLLTNHFNYELAKTPSLSIRVQLFVGQSYNTGYIFDFYDDRGFDVYHSVKSFSKGCL